MVVSGRKFCHHIPLNWGAAFPRREGRREVMNWRVWRSTLSPETDQVAIRGLWPSLPIVFRILLLFSCSCLLPLICCTEQSQEGHGGEKGWGPWAAAWGDGAQSMGGQWTVLMDSWNPAPGSSAAASRGEGLWPGAGRRAHVSLENGDLEPGEERVSELSRSGGRHPAPRPGARPPPEPRRPS